MSLDQPSLAMDENVVDSLRAAAGPVASLRIDASLSACHSQTTSVASHEGNGNILSTWGRCFPDVNTQGLENKSYGVYGSSSLPLHGNACAPQMPQRPHASFTTPPPPSASCHGQLYSVQELPNRDPSCHQQLISQNVPNFVPRTSLSPVKLPININPQGDSNRIASQPCYLPKTGFGMGKNFLGGSGGVNFFQQGFGGFESSRLWSERSKHGNEKGSLMHFASPTAGSKPIGGSGLSVNDLGTASQQKESFYGFGSHLCPSYKSYPQGQSNRNSSYDSCSMLGMNGQRWPTPHEARQGGKCNGFACSCNFPLDTLSERNRGPRAFKPRSQTAMNGYATDNYRDVIAVVYNESYNCLDFVVDYKDAKFFVIKSYSEDNVHKSIKYGVWASTPNGNKKLDAAYLEAKKKHGNCPVFLLFSVNASAQFCGVAEMVGPVDFDKSVDYWQQDKWSGQFPVKWHVIKDVPNAQFRHIVLQNNDNKPVTNSRDTQEVELTQGMEMLKTFKNYESQSSILDDFQFYEERQKMMQARKSRQQANQVAGTVTGERGQHPISTSSDYVKKLSKSFAQTVSLNEDDLNSSMSNPLVQHANRS